MKLFFFYRSKKKKLPLPKINQLERRKLCAILSNPHHFLLFEINGSYYYYYLRVDAVNNLESNGHVLNGNTENGVTTLNNVVPVNLTKTDQDIVRLIGQYLKIVGLG